MSTMSSEGKMEEMSELVDFVLARTAQMDAVMTQVREKCQGYIMDA